MRVGGRCAPRVWMSCSYFIWEALLISQHSTHCHFSNPCLPCTWLYFVPLTIIEKLSIYFSVSPAAAAAKSLQSCPTLCDHIDGSPPGSPVPGILQARILEWVAISFSNAWMHAKLLQSRLTLWDSIDGSLTGSLVPGILQARTLEWVAISFSDAW